MSEQVLRARFHDYRKPCIYMITITTTNRRSFLGDVVGDPLAPRRTRLAPRVKLSTVGEFVSKTIGHLKWKFPQISIPAWQIMPDHVHVLVHVKQELNFHFAVVVYDLINACNEWFREMMGEYGCDLLNHEFNDRILIRQGQLQAMIDYIHDNPRRFLVKRNTPDFFKITEFFWKEELLTAVGNLSLLKTPIRHHVRISRRNDETQIQKLVADYLDAAKKGVVLISPFVSPGEKLVKEKLLEAGLPMVVVLDNGFPPLFKPQGAYFDLCAQGKIVFVSPFPYSSSRIKPSKSRFEQMNLLAWRLADDKPVKT